MTDITVKKIVNDECDVPASGSLAPMQQRFVAEYLVDLNATQAAIRAGYSKRNAGKIGPALLGKTRISEALAAERARWKGELHVDTKQWLREVARIAFADVTEVVEHTIHCCRHCYGLGFRYQRTTAE